MFDIFDLNQNRSFLLFFWWTNSCSSRGYQNIFYVSAVPPIPPISAITEVCSSALSVSAEKNDHPVAAAVVGSSTHTPVCVRQMADRALLCLRVWIPCSWSAVVSPPRHPYLTLQADSGHILI